MIAYKDEKTWCSCFSCERDILAGKGRETLSTKCAIGKCNLTKSVLRVGEAEVLATSAPVTMVKLRQRYAEDLDGSKEQYNGKSAL